MARRIAFLALVAGALGCSSIHQYSVHAAENSCGGLLVCTVYGQHGESQSPCTGIARDTVFPGDARWPYTTPGVCDAVIDGRVISTRQLSPSDSVAR